MPADARWRAASSITNPTIWPVSVRHQSSEIETIFGYTYGDEVIHRNNLILL